MPTIFDNRGSSLDQTVRIFDKFYRTDVVVNANEYDLVYGFFEGVCPTRQIAANYAAFLFRVSNDSGISAMELLEELEKMKTDKLLVNSFLAFYLNTFRSKTSLYGVGTIPRPVAPVARNVVQ